MSKGNRPIKARVSQDEWDAILKCIARRNERSREAPWTASDFVRVAIQEKLSKMRRSAAPRRRTG